jgi:hypothetical protein
MPATFVLPKAEHSDARLAMNSLFRCAEDTIAKSTVAAMKPHGGAPSALIRWSRPARFGSKRIP